MSASVDHVTIRVTDFHATRAFYTTVLAPLGVELTFEDEMLGLAEWGDFSIAQDGYYGAYLLDPDGNNVEAVFHARP